LDKDDEDETPVLIPPLCGIGGVYNCPPVPPTVTYPPEITLHPLDNNVVSQVPIYDYSTNPPRIVGYRITSYAAGEIHVSPANYFIPSDPVTWASFLWARVKPLVLPAARNLASMGITVISCPGCEVGLTVIATIDSLNSAITIDSHLRTHEIYISEPLILTPLDDLRFVDP
jgi:hypothetical protein